MSTIKRLRVSHVKGISALDVACEGKSLVILEGANGAGKSSALDSIEMALRGARACPERPVTEGEETGRVVVELDGLVVTRWWTKGGDNTYLKVTGEDGRDFPNPQAVLDKLFSSISFDPLAFVGQKPAEQAKTLLALADLDFSSLDREAQSAYEERRDVNRDLKTVEAELAGIPVHEQAETVTDLAEAMERLACVRANNASIQTLLSSIGQQIRRVGELAEQLRVAEDDLSSLRASLRARGEQQDETPFIGAVEQAKAQQSAALDIDRRRRLLARQAELTQIVATDEETLTRCAQRKQFALETAAWPLPGLSVGDQQVLWHGLPLSQASSGEQLRVSTAIGIALNPELRVLIVRQGSLLDSAGLACVAAQAREHGAQLWIERVADGELAVVVE